MPRVREVLEVSKGEARVLARMLSGAIALGDEKEVRDSAVAALCRIGGSAGEAEPEQSDLDEALELLLDCVVQACSDEEGELDSMCLSSWADAMHLLARHGLLEVTASHGRRVMGRVIRESQSQTEKKQGVEVEE